MFIEIGDLDIPQKKNALVLMLFDENQLKCLQSLVWLDWTWYMTFQMSYTFVIFNTLITQNRFYLTNNYFY